MDDPKGCPQYSACRIKNEERFAILQVELEKLRGEYKAMSDRLSVYEGMMNSHSSRFHTRLDAFGKDLKDAQTKQAENNASQEREITSLKLHFRYIMGIAAGILFLLNFAKKIKNFLLP